MGLLLDLSPDGGMDDEGNDEALEAELLNLVGGGGGGRPQGKKGEGRELNDVLDDDEEQTSTPSPPAMTPAAPKVRLESRILERIEMYKTAIANAKAVGETSKIRRYDRGLKTLQSMLTSVKKGKPVNEDEMPPPVALGGNANVTAESQSVKERELPEPALMPSPPTNQKPLREAQAVLSRQREYKMAAINAKQSGQIDQAKQHYLTAKKLDILVEALDRGEPVDLSLLPPPPEHCAPPPPQSFSKPAAPAAPAPAPAQVATNDLPAPSSLGEALQQRMDIYKSAAEGAKSKGDDRKARMHERIVKQYQDAIRAHKAGRPVSLSDLPVPPGCPPFQGSEGGQQNLMGVLETAMKIANQDADAEDEEEDGPKAKSPAPQAPGGSSASKLGPKGMFGVIGVCMCTRTPTYKCVTQGRVSLLFLLIVLVAQQQVDFLLLRRQAFLRAALRSKQMKDMSGAAQHLRHAKGLDPMITAAKSGLPVDITKIPSFPVSEDDFSLGRSRTSPLSARSSEQYHSLMDLLRKQHKVRKCTFITQLCHVNLAVPQSEKLVEECMQNIEILKNAHAKGQPVPKCHTEERTFNSIKSNSNLTPNDLILYIIRGINLPAPSGVSPNDLDASVKFEFPFPSAEEAQRDKTSTVKGTNSPDFKEQFKLNINRNHRSFKRVVQSKGIKFEIIHKGGLFKTDKLVGSAQLKLEALENHCEMREIIEVMDGRKATGGKLEVKVKIREPVSGAEIQPVTEKWLILKPVSPPEKQKEKAPSPPSKPGHEVSSRSSHTNSSPPQYKLHSFSLLNYDKERLERKIAEYRKNRRDPPTDLIQQHKEVTHRLQWQKAQLERGSPALLTGNKHKHTQDAAKDSLGRLKMVESEVSIAIFNMKKVFIIFMYIQCVHYTPFLSVQLESLKRKRTG
uniref:Coiled-coil and C2 domain-containing protein 1B n=1 Tax=Anabas testudineus TaxID=64144 RepID=A0A7N6B510_ANATE